MPGTNGDYYGDGAGVYDDYDDLSDDLHHEHGTQWKAGTQHGNAQYDAAYRTPSDDRSSYQMPVVKTQQRLQPHDEITRHMMYESALVDCKAFDILSLEEVDTLKKELERLVPRIEAAQRKLILENKVKDAAQNLRKLNGRRADTPQSPESPRKQGQRLSSDGKNQQVEEELLSSQKKVDELNDTIKSLLDRRAQVESTLLKHTAAVLAQEREQNDAASRHRSYEDETVSEYEPDEFDGIRDILAGRTIGKTSKRIGGGQASADHEQYLQSMQTRLEHMNEQLRHIIEEASRSRGVSTTPEARPAPAVGATAQFDQDMARLESNMAVLEREQQENIAHVATVKSSGHEVSSQLEDVNKTLHTALMNTTTRDLDHPPPPQGTDHQEHIGYLHSLIASVEGIFHAHNENSEALAKNNEALTKTAGQSQRLGEYETTINGLWDLLAAEGETGDGGVSRRPSTSDLGAATSQSPRLSESFSLAAFSSRVQHVVTRANGARDQQEILRRQIAQQRDLNGKSDAEKDGQLQEMQSEHDKLVAAHEHLQDELAATMAKHASSENEASQLRAEMKKVEDEFEQLGKTADAKRQEREELLKQVAIHQANHEHARGELAEAQAQLEQITTAKSGKDKEMENLESEVVRLTTELTMAKAELEGAYGSRAERAREAQKGEAEALKDRSSTLEKELSDMTAEFQELTRESLELERERTQLDATIDGLRERCESLEAQLADEKVKWLGNKPAASPGLAEQQAKEATSMVVLRAEFKKMMRDARFEGVKLLRAEQEQRRALEAEVRRLRQANTPLSKTPTV